MSLIVGIDVGGTFTDVVVSDPVQQTLRVAKVLSTENQADGLLRGLRQVVDSLENLSMVVHGTTVATNTILERNGARAALLTTAGFRDVLELRRRDRPDAYGLTGGYRPLIPRSRCAEVTERLDSEGKVVVALDVESARGAIARLRDLDVESVAVCLLHSYADPVHERALAAMLEEHLPGVPVTVSSALASEIGEFERTSTAAINAYVQPRMARYLREVRDRLAAAGCSSEVWVMQSSGGLMEIARAADEPVRTLLSGPAAGTVGAAEVGRAVGLNDVISCDMGGTSFDVALIPEGSPAQSTGRQITYGVPIQLPMVDIHTIGAGGGSIAWVDRGGVLRVGPESAGALPGPASYGRGGTTPTVTDANVVLGRLDPHGRLGTEEDIHLDLAAARNAVQREVADKLGVSLEEAALGIVSVANAKMSGAIRRVSVDRGYDPRQFALVGFGGAGPAHVVELATAIGCSRVLIPPYPGITSALGCLLADVRHDYVQAVNARLDDVDAGQMAKILAMQRADGTRLVSSHGFEPERIRVEHYADMAYARQLHSLLVPLDAGQGPWTVGALETAFLERYRLTFGDMLRKSPIRLVNLRTVVLGTRERPEMLGRARPRGSRPESRAVTFSDRTCDTPVLWRWDLEVGQRLAGPVIVEQEDATTLVPPGGSVAVAETRTLLVEVDQ